MHLITITLHAVAPGELNGLHAARLGFVRAAAELGKSK